MDITGRAQIMTTVYNDNLLMVDYGERTTDPTRMFELLSEWEMYQSNEVEYKIQFVCHLTEYNYPTWLIENSINTKQ